MVDRKWTLVDDGSARKSVSFVVMQEKCSEREEDASN